MNILIEKIKSLINDALIELENPSEEEINFSLHILEIVYGKLKEYQFEILKVKVNKYSSKLIFRRNYQIIKIRSSNYPPDQIYNYEIDLGYSKSYNVEWTYQSKDILTLANIGKDEYLFPTEENMKSNISEALKDLEDHFQPFLNGNMEPYADVFIYK